MIYRVGLGVGGGAVCRFNYVDRIDIKYMMEISMRLRVAFDRADLKYLSGVDVVSFS